MFPHAVTTSSKSSKSTTSLFNEMHKRSLNLSGRRVDRSFVQIRFMPENALSTEVVDVEMVFLTAIKVVKFGNLFGFIGRPRR
jgi:hypothetical protein